MIAKREQDATKQTKALTRDCDGLLRIPFGIIGVVDIVASTEISHAIGLEQEWLLKEAFFDSAERRAAEAGISIVSFTGDGFVFLEHTGSNLNRGSRIPEFCRHLTQDFAQVLLSIGDRLGSIRSGLHIGIAGGAAILGHLPCNRSNLQIVGPAVSLAARLAAEATANEIVMDTSAWSILKNDFVQNETVSAKTHNGLKGFPKGTSAYHLVLGAAPRPMDGFVSELTSTAEILSQLETLAGLLSRAA